MPTPPDAAANDEFPRTSASLVTSRMIIEAWLRTVDRKQGKRFLGSLTVLIETREHMADVSPIRPPPDFKQAAKAEREALSALRQMLGVWRLRLPPK